MIVPTFTDTEVLKELMEDYPSVKRQAKKLSKKLLYNMPKGRIGMDKGKFFFLHERYTTKNGNNWSIGAYCLEGTTKWWSKNHCEAENGYGTKSYFFLRGMKSNYQYYVEVIPHAIRRIRERFVNNFQEAYYADMKAQDLVDTAVFSLHEIGLFFKTGKIRNGIFYPNIDEDGNTHGVVLLKRSMFYARMTPLGNFIFKTFINPQAEKGTMKQEFIHMIFWRR